MASKLNAKMNLVGWEELPLDIPKDLASGDPKLVRMKFNRTYTGDVEGKGVGFYNSNYRNDGGGDPQKATARFAGLTYFDGKIKGLGAGTIVFIDQGTWDPATGALCQWVSDPNSGTGDFAGLKAKGDYIGTGKQEDPFTLELEN